MGPTKRASTGASTPQSGRGPKVAKVEDVFGPVYDLLPLLEGATASSIEMMKASLPHALCTAKEERHTFQTRLLEALADMIAKTEEARTGNIKDAEAAISRQQEEQGTAETRLAAAQDLVASLEAEKSRTAKAQVEAAEAHKSSQERLSQQEMAKDSMEKQKQLLAEARAHFEVELADAWVPARDGVFSPKDWRMRQKAIARVVSCLQAAGAAASLVAAIQAVLKERPESRTQFGLCALQYCERALDGFMHTSLSEIEKEQQAIEAQVQCVALAASAVAAAHAKSEEQTEALIAAENRWCDAATQMGDVREEIRRAGDTAKELAAKHQQAIGALTELQDLVAKFVAIRDEEPHSPAATPAA